MSLLHKLARNLASMSAMRVGSAMISFLLFWFLARRGDPAFVGAYAFLLGVYAFLQQLPLLGLHLAAIRDVAADSAAVPAVATNLGTLALVNGVLLGVACAIVGHVYYPENMSVSFMLLGVSMLPTAWTNIAEAILIGRQSMRAVAIVNLAEAVIRALLSIAAVSRGGALTPLFAVFLAGRLGAASAYLLMPHLPRWRYRLLDWTRLRRHLAECPTFFSIMVLSAALGRLDLLFLSKLASFSEVGVYSVAAKIYEAALMAPSVIASVLFPAFSQALNESRRSLEIMLRTSVAWVFSLALPCVIAAAILSKPLILAVFGPKYADSARVLQILIGAVVMVALNQLLTLALLADRQQRFDLYALIISAICSIGLLATLVPHRGIDGAAWAVLATMGLQLLVRYSFVRYRLKMRPGFHALWRSSVAGAAMLAVTLLPGGMNVMVKFLGGVAAYLITLLAVGGINPETLRRVAISRRPKREAPAP